MTGVAAPPRAAGGVGSWGTAWAAPPVVGAAWAAAAALPAGGVDPVVGTAAAGVLALLCATAAWTDLRERRIPNRATYPALAWSLVVHGVLTAASWTAWGDAVADFAARRVTPIGGLGDAALGLAVGGLPLAVQYRLTGRGAGDVKLAAAIGSWIGPRPAAVTLLAAYCLGGAYAAARACFVVGPWSVARHLGRSLGAFLAPSWVAEPQGPEGSALEEPVPMAGFLAVGVIAAIAWWPLG